MAKPFFVIVSGNWLRTDQNRKQLRRGRIPLGPTTQFDGRCNLFLRSKGTSGTIDLDQDEPHVGTNEGKAYLHSKIVRAQAEAVLEEGETAPSRYLLLFFEGTKRIARCVSQWWTESTFDQVIQQTDVQYRSYDVPPVDVVIIDSESMVNTLLTFAEETEPDLFSVQARKFLDGPHILDRLLEHLMQLRSIEAPNFITVTKGISEELRTLLLNERSPIKIQAVKHSHVELWASVEGQPVTFIDGGVARFDGFPGIDQFALRVGTYRVTPGDPDPATREVWTMHPRVLADVVNVNEAPERPDAKRLQEAIRYVLEAIVLMKCIETPDSPSYAYLHGPLINQFVTYDEGEPYYLPKVLPEFLEEFGLDEATICAAVKDIPHDAENNTLWNGFMAVYGTIINRILASDVPVVGVVERTVSTAVTMALLDVLVRRRVASEAVSKQFSGLIKQYGITDDLLFGCLLKQGEYLTPVTIKKNPKHRAHDRWQAVVDQFGDPTATMIKPHDGTYPVRLELNQAAYSNCEAVVNLTYHTARLLTRYAFPAGLDIADKYAKIPDWMTRAVSRAGAAALMRKAIEVSDDPRVLAQVRRVLAGQPRDFFYRPTTH